MSREKKPSSGPRPTPAPQLPNIPISPDDPFQSDPDLVPPIAPSKHSKSDAPSRPSGNRAPQTPRQDEDRGAEDDPDDLKGASTPAGS